MIESLHIKNFQVHDEFHLDLDPHITTLVGKSDAGKSSIIRAKRWLCLNRPAGDSFIRHGADEVTVSLTVDGHKVTREKGKVNLYRLDKEEWTAFGNDVPDAIASLLNVSNENFQRQHDPSWWFSLSPGQVSKELNSIVSLDSIDKTLANIASELRKSKATVEVTESRLAAAQEQRGRLAWVVEADSALAVLEAKETALVANREQQAGLRDLLDRMREVEQQVQVRVPVEEIRRLDGMRERLEGMRERRQRLQSIVAEIENKEVALGGLRARLGVSLTELKEAMGGTCPVCGQRVVYD